MKTIQLLDLLTSKEKKDFFVVIKNNKRKASYKLLDALLSRKKKKHPDLYEVVFGKVYEEEKDYLLRNEFRLLNQHLEHFIACKNIGLKEEKRLFLKALQKKGHTDLFEKEIKKEIKKCENHDDYRGLVKLYQLILDESISRKSFTATNLQKMLSLNEKVLFFQKKARLYEEGASLVTKAYLTKNANLSSKSLVFEDFNEIPEIYKDAYLSYLRCKADGYVRFGEEKRKSLQEALLLIDKIAYYDFDKQAAKVATLSNLALEYLLAFDYHNALIAYEKLIPIIDTSGSIRYYILFNYLNCLLKAKKYDKAIALIERDFSGNEQYYSALIGKLQCIKAMARIFTGDLELAYAELLPNTKKGVRNNYFYARLVLTIIFYLEGNIELARRENSNILQIIEEEIEQHYLKFCAKSFRTFLALEDTPKANLKKKKQLLTSVNEFINIKNNGSDILPLLWLKERLSKC